MSTLTEKREKDAKERRDSMRRTLQTVADALRNAEGYERLLAIPDDEWEQAMMRDQGEERAA